MICVTELASAHGSIKQCLRAVFGDGEGHVTDVLIGASSLLSEFSYWSRHGNALFSTEQRQQRHTPCWI